MHVLIYMEGVSARFHPDKDDGDDNGQGQEECEIMYSPVFNFTLLFSFQASPWGQTRWNGRAT